MDSLMTLELQEKISSQFANQFQDRLEHENTRKKIISVFQEQIKMTDFADLIKKYAGEEMDKRVFRSLQYWSIVIITSLITSGIGVAIGYLVTKK
jgi:hypothetical protein